MFTVTVSVCWNKGYTQAKLSSLNSTSKEYMLFLKFNFSVGGGGDEIENKQNSQYMCIKLVVF